MANESKTKTWRLSPESQAHVTVMEDSAFVGANSKNFVAVDGNGITFRGSESKGSMGEGQRTGGFFVNMNEMIKMIPTTMVTPIPPVLPIPPFGFIVAILGAVTAITALTMLSSGSES